MGISIIGGAPPAGAKEKRVQLFTATGSWTAPAGVTYAIAHIMPGGGGGGSRAGSGSAGGNSSALGQTANGATPGTRMGMQDDSGFLVDGANAAANTGNGGASNGWNSSSAVNGPPMDGKDGSLLMFGSTVTPGTSYTITVGAGGAASARGGAGGSGYVAIEFYV